MSVSSLVLMHGLWDTPRLFRRLIQALDQPERPSAGPHLPHGLGHVPLRELARRLDRQIRERFGDDTVIDLFGFSMGGVISRIWLQELEEPSEPVASSVSVVLRTAPWPRCRCRDCCWQVRQT